MNVKTHLNSFLKADDYPRPALLTVESLSESVLGEEKEEKLILYFAGVDGGLVLNKTNLTTCCEVFGGTESDHWVGKQIVIYTDPTVRYAGKLTPALRLRAPIDRAQRPAPVAAPVSAQAPTSQQWADENRALRAQPAAAAPASAQRPPVTHVPGGSVLADDGGFPGPEGDESEIPFLRSDLASDLPRAFTRKVI